MNNCLIDDRRIKVGHASALCMCSGWQRPPSLWDAQDLWKPACGAAPWQPGVFVK